MVRVKYSFYIHACKYIFPSVKYIVDLLVLSHFVGFYLRNVFLAHFLNLFPVLVAYTIYYNIKNTFIGSFFPTLTNLKLNFLSTLIYFSDFLGYSRFKVLQYATLW